MKRWTFVIWMIGLEQNIVLNVDDMALKHKIMVKLESGTGIIQYGSGKTYQSYLCARNVRLFHVTEVES